MKEKKRFDFAENVTYNHSIEFEIDENDVDAEIALDDIYDRIEEGDYDCPEDIVHDFREVFGESVTFIEDGSPDVEYVAY